MGTDCFAEKLAERYEAVQTALLEAKMRCEKAPNGLIHVVKNGKEHKRTQFYLRKTPGDRSGTYLRQGNETLIQALIQKEYDQKLIRVLEKESLVLERARKFYERIDLQQVYSKMGQEKRKFVTPVYEPTEVFVKNWKEDIHEEPAFMEDSSVYFTKNNERVRSKSEVIIANLLADYGVPYKYEYPLMDKTGIWAWPDFTVLNVKRRRVYYWEHMGMMEEASYAKGAIKKIANYEKHGLYQGESLIVSFESLSNPIDTKQVEKLIKHFLLE